MAKIVRPAGHHRSLKEIDKNLARLNGKIIKMTPKGPTGRGPNRSGRPANRSN